MSVADKQVYTPEATGLVYSPVKCTPVCTLYRTGPRSVSSTAVSSQVGHQPRLCSESEEPEHRARASRTGPGFPGPAAGSRPTRSRPGVGPAAALAEAAAPEPPESVAGQGLA